MFSSLMLYMSANQLPIKPTFILSLEYCHHSVRAILQGTPGACSPAACLYALLPASQPAWLAQA